MKSKVSLIDPNTKLQAAIQLLLEVAVQLGAKQQDLNDEGIVAYAYVRSINETITVINNLRQQVATEATKISRMTKAIETTDF